MISFWGVWEMNSESGRPDISVGCSSQDIRHSLVQTPFWGRSLRRGRTRSTIQHRYNAMKLDIFNLIWSVPPASRLITYFFSTVIILLYAMGVRSYWDHDTLDFCPTDTYAIFLLSPIYKNTRCSSRSAPASHHRLKWSHIISSLVSYHHSVI